MTAQRIRDWLTTFVEVEIQLGPPGTAEAVLSGRASIEMPADMLAFALRSGALFQSDGGAFFRFESAGRGCAVKCLPGGGDGVRATIRPGEAERADKKRERFEAMAVRAANRLGLSKAATFHEIPPLARQKLEAMRYCHMVLPLIVADREAGMSLRMLEIKYGMGKSTIDYHLKNAGSGPE